MAISSMTGSDISTLKSCLLVCLICFWFRTTRHGDYMASVDEPTIICSASKRIKGNSLSSSLSSLNGAHLALPPATRLSGDLFCPAFVDVPEAHIARRASSNRTPEPLTSRSVEKFSLNSSCFELCKRSIKQEHIFIPGRVITIVFEHCESGCLLQISKVKAASPEWIT